MKLPKREHAQKQPIEDLLRDLSIVLNAHQDIDDALREIQWSPTLKKRMTELERP